LAYSQRCRRGYYVNPGDTCWGIAQKCGISLQTLYFHNGILANGNRCRNLQVGWYLCCVNWNSKNGLETLE
jgi:hypothetical protein